MSWAAPPPGLSPTLRDVRNAVLEAALERHMDLTERRLAVARRICQASRVNRALNGKPGHWEVVGLRSAPDRAVTQRRIDPRARLITLPPLPRPVLRWRWA